MPIICVLAFYLDTKGISLTNFYTVKEASVKLKYDFNILPVI